MMNYPEAVRKHDGRVVAYEATKAANSVARAALACDAQRTHESAQKFGQALACSVGATLAGEGREVPATADIRALIVKFLRQAKQDAVANAYTEYARLSAGLLWRIRVAEPAVNGASFAGAPWDRRRLLEALRASGIARDPAGDVAREVERRIVALNLERISPALIHALTGVVLARRSLEVRNYNARRLGFSLTAQTPHYDAASVEQPLPAPGPALEAFWLQAVHSQSIAKAAAENILSLAPYPQNPETATVPAGQSRARDLLTPVQEAQEAGWTEFSAARNIWIGLRADGAERIAAIARYLALLPPALARAPGLQVDIYFLPLAARVRQTRRASPVSINLAGLLSREALRDPPRAAMRLAQTAGLAVQAHREREEYFKLSPVRGRILPVAIAGLWNAAAWMQGENLDSPLCTRTSRTLACSWIAVLRGALDTLKQQTGMELSLAGAAPEQATRDFWRRDREFFLRDGITLDPTGFYDTGPGIRLSPRMEDLADLVAFSRDIAAACDDPPPAILEAPLGGEGDAEAWRDLLLALSEAGIRHLKLEPGGTARGMKNLSRSIQACLDAYPLFDQLAAKEKDA
jgi:hypothetical protein